MRQRGHFRKKKVSAPEKTLFGRKRQRGHFKKKDVSAPDRTPLVESARESTVGRNRYLSAPKKGTD